MPYSLMNHFPAPANPRGRASETRWTSTGVRTQRSCELSALPVSIEGRFKSRGLADSSLLVGGRPRASGLRAVVEAQEALVTAQNGASAALTEYIFPGIALYRDMELIRMTQDENTIDSTPLARMEDLP